MLQDRYIWSFADCPLIINMVPKCACSTLGQVLHYFARGEFFPDGHAAFHHEDYGVRRTRSLPTDIEPEKRFAVQSVRNPYDRVLSAYLDKMVVSFDEESEKYKEKVYAEWKSKYQFGSIYPEKQVEEFDRFIEFLANVFLDPHRDMHYLSDPHFAPYAPQIREFKRMVEETGGGWIGTLKVETLDKDLVWLDNTLQADFPKVPRFNENPTPRHFPKAAYFQNPQTCSLIEEIFSEDFEVGGYNLTPPTV